jgi:hypothetical protein
MDWPEPDGTLVRYPDHSHPPEESYLLLSPGQFPTLPAPEMAATRTGLPKTRAPRSKTAL